MQIEKPGQQCLSTGIDNPGSGRSLHVGSHGTNLFALDQDRRQTCRCSGPIYNTRVANENGFRREAS